MLLSENSAAVQIHERKLKKNQFGFLWGWTRLIKTAVWGPENCASGGALDLSRGELRYYKLFSRINLKSVWNSWPVWCVEEHQTLFTTRFEIQVGQARKALYSVLTEARGLGLSVKVVWPCGFTRIAVTVRGVRPWRNVMYWIFSCFISKGSCLNWIQMLLFICCIWRSGLIKRDVGWLDIFESQWIVKLKQMFGYTGFSHLWGQTRVVNDRYIKTAVEMRSTDILRQN